VIVRGGTVVTARGVEKADIVVNRGRITEVGPDLEGFGQVVVATGLHVFPGGIDSHVHFNEPGRTEWEDIAHGTSALAAGGYTSFIDMPLNNLPVTTTVEAFDLKLAAMERSATIDFGLWAGLVPGNLDQLGPLVARGAMGFKAFMCPSGIDEFPACDLDSLREGMERIASLGSIVLVHAESPAMLRNVARPTAEEFIASRPAEAEIQALEDVIAIARDTGCRTHVVHVSTVQGMTTIAEAQLRGVDVSGETCPHYLLYSDDDLAHAGIRDLLAGLALAPPARAQTVVVNGRAVVREGRLLTAEEAEIAREIAATSARLAG